MRYRLNSPPSTVHSTRRLWTSLVLLALLLASCAPAAPTASDAGGPSVQEPAPPVVVEPTATLPPDQPDAPVDPAPTESAVSDPLPVATSRGPDLHATNPATVSLASGQLQFVEFFRFT
jgi:hypothetical protein